MVLIRALLLLLQRAEGACHRPSFVSSRALALAILGALVLQSGGLFIEGRRPRPPPLPLAPISPTPPPAPPPTDNCTQLAQLTEGPFWIDENIEAANVRSNLSYGVPLNITLKIVNETQGTCVPIDQARVDLWQCRYDGVYSDEEEESTAGETWLRGYQYTNSTGQASFYTIFPGWYVTRTVHIHLRVRIYEGDGNTTSYDNTTQFFFDDSISTAIFNDVYPYNSRGLVRDTFNNNDSLFTSANVLSLTGSYNDSGGYNSVVELSIPFSSPSSFGANGTNFNNASFVAIS